MTNVTTISLEEVLENCEKWGKSKDEEWIILLDFMEIWFRDLCFLFLIFKKS